MLVSMVYKMGPITLFDKSFLQSLNVDESVWFDHFFLTNVCPLFYVETLADLEKNVRKGRTPEEEVGMIANKFPEMHGTPNAYHIDLCISNLIGNSVPMTGQIIVAGGHAVKVDGQTGTVFNKTPEAEAFSRWQKQKFVEVERLYARAWRLALSTLDLNEVAKGFRALGIDGKSCKSLEDAKNIAESVVWDSQKPFDKIRLAIAFLNIPRHLHEPILKRWSIANYPPLANYAPYAAYVLTVEIFFQVALAAHLISCERPSNRTDIAYLYYLPFCMMFVSSDNLHKRCSSLFLRNDQEFVWGQQLKTGLNDVNRHYSELPESTKEKGIMSFSDIPPKDDNILAQTWDRHFPNWRERKEPKLPNTPSQNEALVKDLKKFTDATPLATDEIDFDPIDTDSLSIERSVRKRKGSWWQVPKDLEEGNNK